MRARLLAVLVLAGCGPVAPFDGVYAGTGTLTGNCGKPGVGVLSTSMKWGLKEHQHPVNARPAVTIDLGNGCASVNFIEREAGTYSLILPVDCSSDGSARLEAGTVQHDGDAARVMISGQNRLMLDDSGCFFKLEGRLTKQP